MKTHYAHNELLKEPEKGKFAFVIPVYNHEHRVRNVVERAVKLGIPVFVVNDGSTDSTYDRIKDISNIHILHHKENMGKGAAIMTGFVHVAKIADWAITVDADGQHNPEDALQLIRTIPDNRRPIVVGVRKGMIKEDAPWTSRFGRKFSNFWVLLSGGPRLSDSQSGFRIYPLPESMNLRVKAKRFQFEVEILVKAKWKKAPVIEGPVSVNYGPEMERISHFRPFIDFLRNSNTFTRLIVQRIFIPSSIRKKQ